MKKKEKTIIGWSEYVEFPEWGIPRIQAKVDTGAKTSALHVEDVRLIKGGVVEFHVVRSRKYPERRHPVRALVIKRAKVRSSTGEYHPRYFVKTRICIGDIEKDILISLVSREKMVFRMLLGRQALEKDFLVDVSHRKTLAGQAQRKTKSVKGKKS